MSHASRDQIRITVIAPDGDVIADSGFSDRDNISIGRSSESDICLKQCGNKVSRSHGVILFDGQQWEYHNLGLNGTYQELEQVETARLKTGTRLRLGKRGPFIVVEFRAVESRELRDSHVLDDESPGSSVSMWIEQIREGDEAAAQKLWERYADDMVAVAQRTLKNSSRRVADEEDVAVVAFKSLLAGIKSGRFPELDHREQLWRLLMVITTRKAVALIQHDERQKRGGGAVRGDSAVIPAVETKQEQDSGLLDEVDEDPSVADGFDRLAAERVAPDIAALMADETRKLLESLPDDVSQQIAVFKMEGYTHEEIAEKLGCNVRTVERRLKQIRESWQRMAGDDE